MGVWSDLEVVLPAPPGATSNVGIRGALGVLGLDLLLKFKMTTMRGAALQMPGGSPATADMIRLQPDSAFWSTAQLNHMEYAYPFAILMFYISYKRASKGGDLTQASQRWCNVSLLSCILFVLGVILQARGKKPHPLRVLGAVGRYASYAGLLYGASQA